MTKTIILQEDGMLSTEAMPVQDITNMMLAAITGATQDIRHNYQNCDDAQELDNELFNFMNEAMSCALHNMFPDFDLRPDLTEEAIMRAENEIMAERVQGILKQDAKIEDMKAHVKKHIDKE